MWRRSQNCGDLGNFLWLPGARLEFPASVRQNVQVQFGDSSSSPSLLQRAAQRGLGSLLQQHAGKEVEGAGPHLVLRLRARLAWDWLSKAVLQLLSPLLTNPCWADFLGADSFILHLDA